MAWRRAARRATTLSLLTARGSLRFDHALRDADLAWSRWFQTPAHDPTLRFVSTWRDPNLWAKWARGEDCPICRNLVTDAAIAELEVCRLMMSDDAPVRGYAWLPFRRHVVELHELSDDEGTAFMRDIRRASRAIARATEAVKLNYEIHGNTVPHLHLHIFPRYRGDQFEGRPIEPRASRRPVYADGEFEVIRERVRTYLAE